MVYTVCPKKVVGLHKTHGDNFVNFLKLVRQHTKGMVGSIIWMLLEKLLLFDAVKEFLKSVKKWQSYRHEFGVGLLLFWDTV